MPTLAKVIIETPSLDGLRLRALAYESLKNSNREPRQAIDGFFAAVRSDRALLFELIGYAATRDRALEYLDSAAADMRNQTEGEEARNQFERQGRDRSSPSAPVSDDGDAHSEDERQAVIRSSSSEAASASIPLPKRGAAELKVIKDTGPKSAFDSIRLRDKTRIGDLPWRAIPGYIRDNSYEAALLIKVKAYCVPADDSALIRDVIPPDVFDRMVQQAAQVAAEAVA
jgi:hypothetical protein